jgi:ParB family chromosome partitioning protein
MTAIIRSDTFYFHLRCEAETKLSPSEEHTLEKHAKRIRETQARVRKVSAEAVMRIGEELTIGRDLLAHYGNGTFGKWVVARCGISRSTAYRAIEAYYRFKDCPTVGQTFEASALYLLASDKVPDEVIDAAIEHAKRGKLVTKKYARRLLERHGVDCPEADDSEQSRCHVANNSGNSEWHTPDEYLNAARAVMGGIDLDPASSAIAQERVQATTFYTVDDDGLTKDWKGRVWLNPPYTVGVVDQFVAKLVEHVAAGDVSAAVVLVNNATETRWFRQAAAVATAVCFPAGRVKFLDEQGNSGAPLQGQAVLYFGTATEAFVSEFSRFGLCFPIGGERPKVIFADQNEPLDKQIETARLTYWQLIAQKAASLGRTKTEVLSEESQYVDRDGNVWFGGVLGNGPWRRRAGRTEPPRTGWETSGLEAAGPPWCPPGTSNRSYYEEAILGKVKRKGTAALASA